MDIRLLQPSDIPHVQQTNITNLPENYFCKYYLYHALSWPQLSYVAVDVSGGNKNPMLAQTKSANILTITCSLLSLGIATEEVTLRCAEDRGLRAGKDGRGSQRRHTAWTHHVSLRDADT